MIDKAARVFAKIYFYNGSSGSFVAKVKKMTNLIEKFEPFALTCPIN
ncbi:MAG TPA: hypothetical protein VEC12_10300 [Bacteroidia bacterium]|nr:hypothetical protein [Bacteroidia bacterium]